ncbi:MAG: GntR family transcriptional regulator [Eubacteriales bacterium]|nr:GntR family transcriptional regulator [Eubacteriales bacterium]
MASTIYEQVVEDIRSKINKGILKPGEMIPSESSLCKEYNTTRMTVRKGLALLTEGGYIYSVPGKGSFVCEPDHNRHILHFNEMDIIKEHADRTQLLEVNIISPTEELIKQLQLKRKQKTVVIRRLSYSQREPFAYDIKYLPYDKGKPIVEEVIQYATFPEIVAARMSLFSVKNELTIWVKKAQGEEIKFLKTEEGHPLMVIEQKLFDDGNKPVGWGKIYFRGEYCHLHAVSSFNDRIKRTF